MVEPRRLPLHTVRKRRELSSQTPVIRLVVADGALLFIVQIQHERHDTGEGKFPRFSGNKARKSGGIFV